MMKQTRRKIGAALKVKALLEALGQQSIPYIHISHTSAIGWIQRAGLRLKSVGLAFLFCPSA
jgi:hypothetical protein